MQGRLLAGAGLSLHHIAAARYREARPHAEDLLAASRTVVPGLAPLACCYELATARALLEQGARVEPDPRLLGFMDVPRMIGSQLALVMTELGQLDRARALRDEALARSREHGTPADLVLATPPPHCNTPLMPATSCWWCWSRG